MTVPSTTRRAGPFTGTGALVAYPFTFKAFEKADLAVTIADSDGLETDLVLDSTFTATLNVDQETTPGGTVNYAVGGVATALPLGYTLVVTGDGLEFEQTADLPQGGNFSPVVIENALDRIVMLLQRLWDGVRRSMRLPDTASDSVSTVLPVPTANNFIGWDSNATALRNVDPNTLATVVAFAAWQSQAFSGDGVTTQFTLSSDPGNVNNLDVIVGAVPQRNNVDFTLSGVVLTFDVAPANGVSIFCRWGQALPEGTSTLQARLASAADGDGDAMLVVQQPVTGARARTQHAKNADWITALDMTGIDPTGAADSSAALQALIDTGGPVLLPEGTYSAAALTQSADDQQFIGLGKVSIVRRSGAAPLLSSSGRAVQFKNIKFLGNSAGSGDCVVCTGDNVVFDHCSSWTNTGYALWCKGNGARITGTCDIYYSPDASGAGIAIGTNGVSTLYAQITGAITSTSTVGIKYFDHGASGIANCQLGTVDMSDGAAYITNCRIVGDYIVGKSFNMIDNSTISGDATLGDGTSLSGIGFGSKVFVQTGSTVTVNVGIRESTLHLAHLGSGVTVTDNLTGTATDVENFIFTAARSYTPAWTAASANPSLGNGTLTGTYVRNGRMVTDTIALAVGSTTTTGTGEYFFSTSHNPGTIKYCGSGVILDAGTALFTANMRTRGDGTARMNGYTNNAGTGLQQNAPMTWATGDTLDATISYAAP